MKTIKQTVRQPMRTLAGILLIAMAVSILITCVGQYAAAMLTRSEMDRQYDTVALTTDADQLLNWPESGEYYDWYQNLVENNAVGERTDIIETISNTGLLSAYIPQLTPDNYTQYDDFSGNYGTGELGVPYNCTVLVVTLNEIGTEVTEDKISVNGSDRSYAEINKSASISCKGTVEQVISLQEGFNSPEGWTINLTINAANRAALDAMELKTGQQYLVYGMDYFDDDWLFRQQICENQWNFAQPFDMDKVYTDHPLGPDYEWSDNGWEWYYYENIVKGEKVYVGFDADSLLTKLRNCSLTVCDYASLPHVVFRMDENNNILGFEGLVDQRVLLENEHSDLMQQYGSTLVTKEEYMQMYSVPTMAELNSSVEEFLNSADGEVWQTVLNCIEINNHAFPVLAVDKLGYQAEFAREQARIVQGRDFTQQELENGEKVCIISESQAVANGLSVGDTISMQTFHHDPNITEPVVGLHYPNEASPYASFYSQARGFSSELESYTIVGMYRLNNERGGKSSYEFTSSTLFIPKKSASESMVTSDRGVFRSIILQNGKLDAFNESLAEVGYEDMFVVYDRGYSEIFSGLNAYEEVAGKAIYIGIGAYAVIMLLYLLLFPSRQKKTLATMGSLGTPKGRKFVFVISSSFTIILPGTILGAVVSLILRDSISAELMKSVGVSIPLVFNSAVITLSAAIGQLVVVMMAVSICGLLLVKEHGMARK